MFDHPLVVSALVALSLSMASAAPLQSTVQSTVPQTIPLWSDGAPGAQGNADIDQPSLSIYLAERSAKVPTGVVICPGGGYVHLAMDHEGVQIAAWLNHLGISAFVLKYRLGPKYHYPVQLWDAQRALRIVRAHATEWGIKPNQIGMWGFSAGGHLASTSGTHFDSGDAAAGDPINRQSSRPDFMILAYSVISLDDPYAHVGSRLNLLGEKPDPALIEFLSNERQVTTRTPPTFLFHTTDDTVVPVENSVMFYLALRRAGIPAEMHLYPKGRHGVGLAQNDPVLRTWSDHLADWLAALGLR